MLTNNKLSGIFLYFCDVKDIAFTYSEDAQAWVSDKLTLVNDMVLTISLKNRGKVAIKKQNGADSPFPKIHVSPGSANFRYTFRGETEGRIIQIFTSTEPNYMRYGYIQYEDYYAIPDRELIEIECEGTTTPEYVTILSNTSWKLKT